MPDREDAVAVNQLERKILQQAQVHLDGGEVDHLEAEHLAHRRQCFFLGLASQIGGNQREMAVGGLGVARQLDLGRVQSCPRGQSSGGNHDSLGGLKPVVVIDVAGHASNRGRPGGESSLILRAALLETLQATSNTRRKASCLRQGGHGRAIDHWPL